MDSKKVFISYSHDSPAHAERVAGLAASLRRDGVDCRIDRYVKGSPPEGWPLWMEKTLEWAEFVLVVCTETYHRRVRKEEPPGKGLGATWEAHLIYQHLYEAHLFIAKFIPVVFDSSGKEFIPIPLRGVGYYRLDEQKGYDDLYVVLTGQHKPTPDLGKVKRVRHERTKALFAEPGGTEGTVTPTLKESDLKIPGEEPYPDEPYPVLLPYTHRGLFAGRERDLSELVQRLTRPPPILGVFSTSGAGKSSLLRAGLAPALRENKHPVAYWARPGDPMLAAQLLDCLLEESAGHRSLADDNPEGFVDYLQAVRRLTGKDPVLIVDQFEEALDSTEARARAGLLLAASVQWSLCRWVLCYRDEYHGQVVSWLNDVLQEARKKSFSRLERLPYDLSRLFQSWPLEPFGTAASGFGSAEVSVEAFRSAIEAPLTVREGGNPKYGISFADGAAERLAKAFAKARTEQSNTPLLPELQVVLAHLLKKSNQAEVQVPENPEKLIAGALAGHLRKAIKEVAESPARRAEVLLALRDLATDDGKRGEGRPVQELEDALDAKILKRLSDEYRVLYRERREGQDSFLLSHDRIAEAIVEQIDSPKIQGWLDTKLISLRRFVTAKAMLLKHDPRESTSMTTQNYRRISSHAKALLWDKNRKDWWSACEERIRQRIEKLKNGLAGSGDPVQALRLVSELSDLGMDRRDLSEQLEKRSDLPGVFEDGPALVPEKRRNTVLVAAADSCWEFLPNRLNEHFESSVPVLGVLLWVLDSGPLRDEEAVVVAQAREIRRSIVDSLRRRNPNLPLLAADDWALITGGTFQMGSEAKDAVGNERPVHKVEVSSFRLLKHQVTNAEFAQLFEAWASEAKSKPRHPAVNLTWYQAYVFAAWLGGRLPTEAEWEYAARSGGKDRRYPWGNETHGIHQRSVVKSFWRSPFRSGPLPVCSKPKGDTDQGVSDMAGNVWEWVTDWYGGYASEAQRNPWGPVSTGGGRVVRGGTFNHEKEAARVSDRFFIPPGDRFASLGLRVALPVTLQS